jgi:hypothetical protein
MKYVLALVIGLGIGYYTGYKDGSEGNPSIGERVTDRIGGKSRDRVGNDIDARMKQVEESGKPTKRP